jgi:hypothetical protein
MTLRNARHICHLSRDLLGGQKWHPQGFSLAARRGVFTGGVTLLEGGWRALKLRCRLENAMIYDIDTWYHLTERYLGNTCVSTLCLKNC